MRLLAACFALTGLASAQVIPDKLIRSVAAEVSTQREMRTIEDLGYRDRYPVSVGLIKTADFVAAQARELGLQDVSVQKFPAKEPMWDPVFGSLDLLEPDQARMVSTDEVPLLIMERSKPGEVIGELVDAGFGTKLSDYEGLQLKGKIVLTRDLPSDKVWGEVAAKGAVALISSASMNLFGRKILPDAYSWLKAPEGAMAMSISSNIAARFADVLRSGRTIKLKMKIEATTASPGSMAMAMGQLPGRFPGQDIVMVAHLDHAGPAANDNASGSAVLIEAARVIKKLIASRAMPPLQRSIRFWWSTEIESENAYFEQNPADKKNILLAINIDQAGGSRFQESTLISIRNPNWVPSYLDDLTYDLLEYLKARYASPEKAQSMLLSAADGTSNSLRTVYWEYARLSDHISFAENDVDIPFVSLASPSLDVIHTNLDTSARIDTTMLKRASTAAIVLACFLANAGPREASDILELVFRRAASRLAQSKHPEEDLETELKRIESIKSLDPQLDTQVQENKLKAIAAAMALQPE